MSPGCILSVGLDERQYHQDNFAMIVNTIGLNYKNSEKSINVIAEFICIIIKPMKPTWRNI